MAIVCAISTNNQKVFKEDLASVLSGYAETNSPLDLKSLAESIYTDMESVYEGQEDQKIKALSYVMLLPDALLEFSSASVKSSNKQLADYILANINLQEVSALSRMFRESFENIYDYVSTKTSEQELLENLVQQTLDASMSTNIKDMRVSSSIKMNNESEFAARSYTLNKTGITNVLSSNPKDAKFNVENPDYVYLSEVKKKIIQEVNLGHKEDGTVVYPGIGKIYVRAMAPDAINALSTKYPDSTKSKLAETNIGLVIVNERNQPVFFDKKGNANLEGNGQMFVDVFPDTSPKNITNAAESLSRKQKLTKAEAEALLKEEVAARNTISNYVLNNPTKVARYNINGGKSGYIHFDFNIVTFISNINFGEDDFLPYIAQMDSPQDGEKSGKLYFRMSSLPGISIEIERPRIAPDFANQIATLLTADLRVMKNGYAVKPMDAVRVLLASTYLYTNDDFNVKYDPQTGTYSVSIFGNPVDLSNRQQAFNQIQTYLTQLGPKRILDNDDALARIEKGAEVIEATDPNKKAKYKVGSIVREVVGDKEIYKVVEYPKIHFQNNALKKGFYAFKLTPNQDVQILEFEQKTPADYKEFIRENGHVHYQLNGDKKIVSVNPYITMFPTQETLSQVFEPEKIELQDPGDFGGDEVADDNYDFLGDWADLPKSQKQKLQEMGVTKEKLEEAKAWYETSPLSEYVPFYVMFNAVNKKNPDSVANFANMAITLFKGSDYSDLYHEAYHGFTQLFLTPEQREDLYREVIRKNTGKTFVDFKGNTQSFDTATFKQIDEYLAEDFREYMIKEGKPTKGMTIRNRLFRFLRNLVNAIAKKLGIGAILDEKSAYTIDEIYKNLRFGNIDVYTFNEENRERVAFDKTMIAIEAEDPIQTLSPETTRDLLDSTNAMIAEYMDYMNKELTPQQMAMYNKFVERIGNGEQLNEAESTLYRAFQKKATGKFTIIDLIKEKNLLRAYKYTQKRFAELHNKFAAELDGFTDYSNGTTYGDLRKKVIEGKTLTFGEKRSLVKIISNPEFKQTKKKVDTYFWALRNFGNTDSLVKNEMYKGVIGYHQAKSKYVSQQIRENLLAELETEQDKEDFKKFENSGNDTSFIEMAEKEILYMVSLLTDLDEKGNPRLNNLGTPKLVDGKVVMNKLAKLLVGSMSPQVMEKKLREQVETFPVLKQLLYRLGDSNVSDVDGAYQMWDKFFNSFNLTRKPPIMVNLNVKVKEKEKETEDKTPPVREYNITVGSSPNQDLEAIKSRWSLNMQTKPLKYFKEDRFGRYLDADGLKKMINGPYNKIDGNEYEFLAELGIMIPEAVKENKEDNAKILKYGKYIYNKLREAHFKNGDSDVKYTFKPIRSLQDLIDPFDKTIKKLDVMSNTDIKFLAEVTDKYTDSSTEFMYTNPKGDSVFELTKNSSITQILNAINEVSSFEELMRRPETQHFAKDKHFFVETSLFFNTIFNFSLRGGPKREYSPDGREVVIGNGKPRLIKIEDLSGILKLVNGVATDTGDKSSALDGFSKFMHDFYASLEGVHELPRLSDKSSYSSVSLPSYNVVTAGQVRTKFTHYTDLIEANDLTLAEYQAVVRYENKLADKEALTEEEEQNYNFLKSKMPANGEMEFLTKYVLLPYLSSEYNRVQRFKDLQNQFDNLADGETIQMDFDYLKRGQEFKIFQDILSPQTQEKIMKIEGDLLDYLRDSEDSDLETNIYDDIRHYFEDQTNEVIKMFEQTDKGIGFIAPTLLDKARGEFVSTRKQFIKPDRNDVVIRGLVRAFVLGTFINIHESNVLFFGDPAEYNMDKDEYHKRNALLGSPGDVPRNDDAAKKYINSQGRLYAKSQGFSNKYQDYDGVLQTAVLRDKTTMSVYLSEYIDVVAEREKQKLIQKGTDLSEEALNKEARRIAEDILDPYTKMTAADGQAWISFDTYRYLMKLYRKWLPEHEKMYMDIVEGKSVDSEEALRFFPILKLQYAGPVFNEYASIITEHKYSLFPLVPPAIEDTKLKSLHDRLMNNGMDYAVLLSGAKIGAISTNGVVDGFYEDYDTRTMPNIETPFTKNPIYVPYLKYQTHIEPEFKEETTLPSQMRYLIEGDLYEDGVPTDFVIEGEVSEEERKRVWDSLSKDEKKESSLNHRYITQYEKHLWDFVAARKKELLRKFDFTYDNNGKLVGDINKLLDFVEKELVRQDVSEEDLDFLSEIRTSKNPDLSLLVSADKVERLLNAIIVRKLSKPKVYGEPLIQVANMGFETEAEWGPTRFKLPEEEIRKKLGSDSLPFYTTVKNQDGKIVKVYSMKVKIAMQGSFKSLLKDEEVLALAKSKKISALEALNQLLRSEEWLDKNDNRRKVRITGPRIPSQKQNSLEFAEVLEFLPEKMGNMIVLPEEIVAKTGGDFDVDKIFFLLPYLTVRDKKVELFKNIPKEAVKEMYSVYRQKKAARAFSDLETLKYDIEKSLGVKYNEVFEDVDFEELQEEMLSNKKLMTLEDFEDMLLGEKAIHNDLMQSMVDILSLPENFVNLIVPNSTRVTKALATELSDKTRGYDTNRSSWSNKRRSKISTTRIFEVGHNLFKHVSNSVGKQALGIGAVDNKFNAALNRIGFRMNKSFIEGRGKKSSFEKRIELKLDHAKVVVDGVEYISLGKLYDKDLANNIGEIISELINGWVDVAKDAWIFDIQGNKLVSPTLLYMIQAGVPVRTAVYFISQPLIRDYIKKVLLAKSPFGETIGATPEQASFAQFYARRSMLTDPRLRYIFTAGMTRQELKSFVFSNQLSKKNLYNQTVRLTDSNPEAFDISYLEDNVGTLKYTEQALAQLLHFFEIEDQAKALTALKINMAFDTAKSSTLYDALNRLKKIDELKRDGRYPAELIDKLINESPIGPFVVQDFQIDLWSRLFPTRNSKTMNDFISDILDNSFFGPLGNRIMTADILKKSFEDEEAAIETLKNDFMSFLFQKEIKTFDLKNLQYYSGLDAQMSAKEAPAIRTSAVVMKVKGENVVYYNIDRINSEFAAGSYLKDTEFFSGVKREAFMSGGLNEYQHFVLERAVVMNKYSINDVVDMVDFKAIQKRNLLNVKQEENETVEQYNNRILLKSYKDWVRDTALFNINNYWQLFKSEGSLADMFELLKTNYPELERYSVMNGVRQAPVVNGFKTLRLVDPKSDSDTINLYKDNMLSLTNYSEPKTGDKKIDDFITKVFKKMTVVAMVQTGYNQRGVYALSRITNNKPVYEILKKATVEFNNKTEKEKEDILFFDFFQKWMRENSSDVRTRDRYKDFNRPTLKTAITDKQRFEESVSQYGSTKNKVYDKKEAIGNNVDQLLFTHSDDTFVFETTVNPVAKTVQAEWALAGSTEPNKLGLKIRKAFNTTEDAKFKDTRNADGTITPNPTLIKNIDEFIAELETVQGAIVFPRQGLGLYMIGLNEAMERKADDAKSVVERDKAPAPASFAYLSEKLFEKFGFINPYSLDINLPESSVKTMMSLPVKEVDYLGIDNGKRVTKLTTEAILLDTQLAEEQFYDKVWTKVETFSDGSQNTPLAQDYFQTPEEWLGFVIFRAKAQGFVFQADNETRGAFVDRIVQAALKEIGMQKLLPISLADIIDAGTMNYNVGMLQVYQTKPGFFRKELADKKITSTWYAVISGLRTQTTRNSKAVTYSVGDYISFTNTFFKSGATSLEGKRLVVKVTNIGDKSVAELLKEDSGYAETWSKKEGWTPQYLKDNPQTLSKYPVEFEYVGVMNKDGSWDSISPKYQKMLAAQTREFKIPIVKTIPAQQIGIRRTVQDMVHPEVTDDMVRQKMKFCLNFGR